MLPGGRDCWLPHDSGAGLCWQHVGGVGSTTTTTRVGQVRSEINELVSQDYCDVLALLAYDLLDCDLFIFFCEQNLKREEGRHFFKSL